MKSPQQIAKEEIVNDIYKSYGTDSGILFGIKERSIVDAIVEFTISRLPAQQSNEGLREAGIKLAQATSNLLQDIHNKPNDTRYATHMDKAKEALSNWLLATEALSSFSKQGT